MEMDDIRDRRKWRRAELRKSSLLFPAEQFCQNIWLNIEHRSIDHRHLFTSDP